MSVQTTIPDEVADWIYWKIDEALNDYQMPEDFWNKADRWRRKTFRPKMYAVWARLDELEKE